MTPTPTDTSPDLDALNMLQRFQEINYDIGNQDAKGLADESLVMRRESLFASLSYILLRTSPPAAEQPDERTVNEKDLRRRVMAAIRSYGISHQVKADIESRTDGVMIVLGEYVLPFVRKSERESGSGWQPMETAPKDGTTILTVCRGEEGPFIITCWWQDNVWYTGWVSGGHRSDYDDRNPACWMPLPAVPDVEDGASS